MSLAIERMNIGGYAKTMPRDVKAETVLNPDRCAYPKHVDLARAILHVCTSLWLHGAFTIQHLPCCCLADLIEIFYQTCSITLAFKCAS
jgi:hypothetical protein